MTPTGSGSAVSEGCGGHHMTGRVRGPRPLEEIKESALLRIQPTGNKGSPDRE